jgi:sortase A
MNRAALAVACLVTLAGCGSSRASVAPAAPTVAPTTTIADSPTAGVGEPPLTATSTTSTTSTTDTTGATDTTAAPTTTALPVPARAPADSAKEPLQAIGEITITRLGLESTLYEGVTLGTLNNGPGHWPGSALPGQPGNVVVAGHRVSHGRQFRYIDRLIDGDEVVFTVDGQRSVYVVTGHEIVTPNRVDIVNQTPTATATLFACEPPGSTRFRYVVHLVLSASA